MKQAVFLMMGKLCEDSICIKDALNCCIIVHLCWGKLMFQTVTKNKQTHMHIQYTQALHVKLSKKSLVMTKYYFQHTACDFLFFPR